MLQRCGDLDSGTLGAAGSGAVLPTTAPNVDQLHWGRGMGKVVAASGGVDFPFLRDEGQFLSERRPEIGTLASSTSMIPTSVAQ